MKIADHTVSPSYLAVSNSNRLITLGYITFAIVAVAVLYFASSGPGVTEAEFAIATVFP